MWVRGCPQRGRWKGWKRLFTYLSASIPQVVGGLDETEVQPVGVCYRYQYNCLCARGNSRVNVNLVLYEHETQHSCVRSHTDTHSHSRTHIHTRERRFHKTQGTQAFAAAALVDLVAVGIPCNFGDDAQHLVRSLSSIQAH